MSALCGRSKGLQNCPNDVDIAGSPGRLYVFYAYETDNKLQYKRIATTTKGINTKISLA